jgi:S-adenosylmethionine uptake transporter
VYLVATLVLTPIVIAIGDVPNAHPSVAFLLRSWAAPPLFDGAIMAALGLVWAGGMYFTARAYSAAPASLVAPFEYSALPISVLWGFVIWRELPTWTTWAGAALTLASGLYILYRERKERAAQITVHGARYPESLEQQTNL